MIKDLRENERISINLLVSQATKGVTTNGGAYLNITFQDATGTIDGRKWEVLEKDYEVFVAGNIVNVKADVIEYRNTLQLKVLGGDVVNSLDVEVSDFVASAPEPRELMQRKLLSYINAITNEDVRRIVEEIVKKDLMQIAVYPAASRNHHEYASGLLHHTVGMLDCAKALLAVYSTLDANYLYAGVILHDLGKLVELSGPILPHYTMEGKLLGHISIMSARIQEVAKQLNINSEARILLQHMVLSHHGQHEFGSPVLPLTKEAEVLCFIDNLDARLNMINKALEGIEEGEFTGRIPSLEGRTFYKVKK